MVTEDSTVYYNRSIMGTFTVKLKVVAEWEQAAQAAGKGIVQKTGHFSGSLKLQGESGRCVWGVGRGCRFSASCFPAASASGQGHEARWAASASAWGGNTETRSAWLWQEGRSHSPGLGAPRHLSSATRFNGALCLSETLRGIQVMGPTEIQAFQEMTVTLNFLGR